MNRLEIRLFEEKESEELKSILSDKLVGENYRGIYWSNEIKGRRILELFLLDTNIQVYSIILSNKLIGIILLEYDINKEDTIAVSYVLDKQYRGNGYMVEALKLLIKQEIILYFEDVTLEFHVLTTNISSMRVMEKLGAEVTKGVYTNEYRLQL